MSDSPDRTAWAIPQQALVEWLRLAALLEELGTVPCRTSDPEAWWPDRKKFDGPAAQMAVDACCACPAMDACLAYAVAAGEQGGIWGGTLPDERRSLNESALGRSCA